MSEFFQYQGKAIMTDTLLQIPLDEIFADSDFNCRGKITPLEVIDLVQDIKKNGLMQPVTLTPASEEFRKKHNTTCLWRLVAGFRRHMAYTVLRRDDPVLYAKVNSLVKPNLSEERIIAMNLSENLNRVDLNIMQEARSINRLYMLGLSEQAVALAIGKSRGWVQIRYMLLSMPHDIQEAASAGFFTQTQIRDMYYLKDPNKQVSLAKKIKEAKQRGDSISKVVAPKKVDMSKAKRRSPAEIETMLDFLMTDQGMTPSLATRALAWAAGNITTIEFLKELKDAYADEGLQLDPLAFETYKQELEIVFVSE